MFITDGTHYCRRTTDSPSCSRGRQEFLEKLDDDDDAQCSHQPDLTWSSTEVTDK